MIEGDHARTQHPALVIMDVSGRGKSTVAGILAGQLEWDLAEDDDLHLAANVTKMAAGLRQPMTIGGRGLIWSPAGSHTPIRDSLA